MDDIIDYDFLLKTWRCSESTGKSIFQPSANGLSTSNYDLNARRRFALKFLEEHNKACGKDIIKGVFFPTDNAEGTCSVNIAEVIRLHGYDRNGKDLEMISFDGLAGQVKLLNLSTGQPMEEFPFDDMQYGYGKGWPEDLVLNIVLCSPEEWKQLNDKDNRELKLPVGWNVAKAEEIFPPKS